MRLNCVSRTAMVLGLLVVLVPASWGQIELPRGKRLGSLSGDSTRTDSSTVPVAVSAAFTSPKPGEPSELRVTARIAPGWHIYAISQKPVAGAPPAARISLEPSSAFQLKGEFQPETQPNRYVESQVDTHPEVETHEGEVTWRAPIEFHEGVDLRSLTVNGTLTVAACSKVCRQDTIPFTAGLLIVAEGTYADENAEAVIRGHLEPKGVTPGQSAKIVLAAEPNRGWHVYPLAERVEKVGSAPTLIVLSPSPGLSFSKPAPSGKLTQGHADIGGAPAQQFYEKPVSWTINVEVSKETKPGQYQVAGLMGFQTCKDAACKLPAGLRFEGTLTVGPTEIAGLSPLRFSPARYAEVAKAAEAAGPAMEPAAIEVARMPLAGAMLFAFLGGLILNLMPCVLPVIGLKIFSFLQQAHGHRRQVLALNLWYTAGMMSVFMVLASLAVFAGFGWGQLFGHTGFTVTLAAVVFVMGLSFLDVWEFPIPGFVGRGKATEWAHREGAAGAFAKGVVTTILATPCSGPFLATALAWSVIQPPQIVYGVFACIGLGMASPYLILGAFPQLVRFLPRPGIWMETLQQAMAFVLFGTVVYILSFIEQQLVVRTVAFLFGLWAICWWIGRAEFSGSFAAKLRAWGLGAVAAALLALACYSQFDQRNRLAWEPFSRAALEEHLREGKTVMVDFTADWCLTCKYLEKTRLNTAATRKIVESNHVVPLVADWTHNSPEVTEMLEELGSKQIPALAIYPAGRPKDRKVLIGAYSETELHEALEQAGPSTHTKTSSTVSLLK